MNNPIQSAQAMPKRYYLPARPYGLALFQWYFPLRVSGVEHIPTTGPVILAPNHTSFLDPPLIAAVVPRVVHFLMLQQHFEHPLFHWLFSRLPCIPMKRGGGSSPAALKMCLQALAQAQVLCVFPEGGISAEQKARGLRQGAVVLASKAQAPLVPVAIRGADVALPLHHKLPRRRPITITIGEPLYVPQVENSDKNFFQDMTEQTMQRVQILLASLQE